MRRTAQTAGSGPMDGRPTSAHIVQIIFAAAGRFQRLGIVAVRWVRLQTQRLMRVLIRWSDRGNRWIEAAAAVLVRVQMMMVVMKGMMMVMQVASIHPGITVVAGEVQRQHVKIVIRGYGWELVQLLLAGALRGNIRTARRCDVAGAGQRSYRPSTTVTVFVRNALDGYKRKVYDAR